MTTLPIPIPNFSEEMSIDVSDLSVAGYFYRYLGYNLDPGAPKEKLRDENGLGMPINSVCGFSCKQAIDAARAFYPFCANASAGERCIELAREACMVMIFG